MAELSRRQMVADTAQLWRQIRQELEAMQPSPWLRLSLSRGQLRIMTLLSSSDGMSPGAVAAALGVPKANVTEIIERLVKQGLVRREPNPGDRRSHKLVITALGTDEMAHLREWSTRRIEKVFERLPADRLAALSHSLYDMLEAARTTASSTTKKTSPGTS
jgi:DNA-binding MarR family transcriptional regulator